MPCIRKIIGKTFIFQQNIFLHFGLFWPAFPLLSVCSCWRSSSCCGTLSGSRTFWYFNCTSFLCGNENSYQVMNIWNWFLKTWPTSSIFRILISSIWKAWDEHRCYLREGYIWGGYGKRQYFFNPSFLCLFVCHSSCRRCIFSCPEQLNRWPCHWVSDFMTIFTIIEIFWQFWKYLNF